MPWPLGLPPGVVAEHLLALVGALLAGALATRVAMTLAGRAGFVSRPAGDRWSNRPVALGGGVALYVVLALGLALYSRDLLLAATVVFLLGLLDDVSSVSPPAKLVTQTVAAAWMVAGPLDAGPAVMLFDGPQVLSLPLTVAWYVGMANSVNLLDNMDGSAAGVTAIAGLVIYVLAVGGHAPDPELAACVATLIGAALGFLLFNFPPARVFMGDAGSLLLGFVLAGLTLRLPRGGEAGIKELAVAAFVLGIPLFDTALVWFGRRAARRPFLQGGRDHLAHRLVALGLSERRTVLVLYGAAAALGGVAIAVARGDVGTAAVLALACGVALVLLGVFLGDVPVYPQPPDPAPPPRPRASLLFGVELLVDVGVVSGAWLGAYAIRFDSADLPFYLRESALPALPFVIAIKVTCLLLFGLYRGFWRTIAFRDVLAIAKAVTLASGLVVVTATAVRRFENYSRGVVLIDLLLTFAAVLGTRSALRLLRHTLSGLAGAPKRAVLLGPSSLQPLVERALTGEPYLLVGRLEDAEPAAAVAAARELGAEVALVLEEPGELGPALAALRAAGLEVHRLTLVLE